MIEEEASLYFKEMDESFDHFQNSHVNRDACFTLADLSKQLSLYHSKIVQKIDSLSRLEQVQKNLTNLMISRFENISQAIERIQCKIGLQTVINTTIRSNVDQSPNIRIYSIDALDNLEIDKTSHIIHIEQFQRQDSEEDQNIKKSVLAIPHSKNNSLEDPNFFFDTSFLLDYLSSTFTEMNLKFSKCQKLYEFPQLRDINFHNKIDNKDNILFLAQLENNQMIGAFTNRCFDPAPNYIPKQNSKSFICNLTHSLYAYTLRVNKTHTHDPNYLLFGNWQIKVKVGADVLQTNWGTNGDCFLLKKYGGKDVHKMKPNDFFGPGAESKKIKMKRYNFYVFY